MTARTGLGDIFNLATSATTAKTRVNMKNATGCTFVLIGATSGAATINECNAASGGTEQLYGTAINASGVSLVYFTQNNGLWTKATGTVSQVTAAAGGLLAVYVSAVNMSAGFGYLDATHSAGSFVYILHGMQLRRDPANLAAVTA